MTDHQHSYKNGLCVCGVESNNGRIRRLKREAREKAQAREPQTTSLYEALRHKDGLS